MRQHALIFLVREITACCLLVAFGSMWLAPLAFASEPSLAKSAPTPHRWAIVASSEVEESGFSELLTAELSQLDGMKLVERSQLDKALKELERSALFSGNQVGDRLRLGELVGADVLLLLSLEKPEEGEQAASRMHVLAIDCRYGARIGETRTIWSTTDFEGPVGELDDFVTSVQQRFPRGVQVVVGLPDFLSKTFRHDWDYLQSDFAQLVRTGLSVHPGVAVLETDEVNQIVKELKLTGSEIKGGMLPIFVEGEYEILNGEKLNADRLVQMALRLHRSGTTTPFEFECKLMTLDEITKRLSQNVPATILQMARHAGGKSISLERQAELLLQRANHFADLAMWPEAARLGDASLLANPNQPGVRLKTYGYYLKACTAEGRLGLYGMIARRSDKAPPSRQLITQLLRGRARHLSDLVLRKETDMLTAYWMLQDYYEDSSRVASNAKVPSADLVEIRSEMYWTIATPLFELENIPRPSNLFHTIRHKYEQSAKGRRLECSRHLIRCLWWDSLKPTPPTGSASGTSPKSDGRFQTMTAQFERLTSNMLPDDLPPFELEPRFLPGAEYMLKTIRREGSITDEEMLASIKRLKESDRAGAKAIGDELDICFKGRPDGYVRGPAIQGYRVLSPEEEGRSGSHVREFENTFDDTPMERFTKYAANMKYTKPFVARGITFELAHSLPSRSMIYGMEAITEDTTIVSTSEGFAFFDEKGNVSTRLPQATEPRSRVVRIEHEATSNRWWIARENDGIYLLDNEGKQLAKFDTAGGLPPVKGGLSYTQPYHKQYFKLLPVAPDRCFALGVCGVDRRIWLTALTFQEDGSTKIDVLLRTTRPMADDRDADNLDVSFSASMHLVQLDSEPPNVVVIRSMKLKEKGGYFSKLVIDPKSLEMSVDREEKYQAYFGHPSRSNFLRTKHYRPDGTIMAVEVSYAPGTFMRSDPSALTLIHSNWSQEKGEFIRHAIIEQPEDMCGLHLSPSPQFLFAPGKAWFVKRQYAFEIDTNTWESRMIDNGETPEMPGKLGTAHHLGLVAFSRGRIWKVNFGDGSFRFSDPSTAIERFRVPEDRQAAFLESVVKLADAKIDVGWTTQSRATASAKAYISPESEITPETLSCLLDIPNLSTIGIVGATLDESCLKVLAKTSTLRKLDLVNVQLNPSSLQMLAGLTELTEFVLVSDDLDATTLDCVPRLPKLKLMSLYGPELTEEDVNRLAKRMPKDAIITWYRLN